MKSYMQVCVHFKHNVWNNYWNKKCFEEKVTEKWKKYFVFMHLPISFYGCPEN